MDIITMQIVNSLLLVFKEKISKNLEAIQDEVNQIIDNGLKKYIINQTEKYSKTKTFLFRDCLVNFYDIYFPLSITTGKKDPSLTREKESNSPTDILSLLNTHKYITILGNAGSGKSMLLKHTFLSHLKEKKKIPIIIELRALNSYNSTIEEYIKTNIFDYHLSQNSTISERLLQTGNFLFLLDGFDELVCSTKEKNFNEINHFIEKYSENFFIITSRPGANVESLDRFPNFYLVALSPSQIKGFIHKQLSINNDWELEHKLLNEIQKPINRSYTEYLSNPLLLSMFILTYNTYPELPRSKNKFYFNVFDTLCTRHDSFTKGGGFLHDKKTKLQNEDFEKILKHFSFISFFEEKYIFDLQYLKDKLIYIKNLLDYTSINIEDLIYDLTVSIAIIVIDGTQYTFPHRSLQEYFTALLINEQSGTIKERIYKEKFINSETEITHWIQNYYNLWSLCEEIDPVGYNKYLIIPLMEKVINRNLNTHDSINSLITMSHLCITTKNTGLYSFAYYPLFHSLIYVFGDNLYNSIYTFLKDLSNAIFSTAQSHNLIGKSGLSSLNEFDFNLLTINNRIFLKERGDRIIFLLQKEYTERKKYIDKIETNNQALLNL